MCCINEVASPVSPRCCFKKTFLHFLTQTQNFYKSEVNKEDMYIRYIHKLCDMHLQAEDFTGSENTSSIEAIVLVQSCRRLEFVVA